MKNFIATLQLFLVISLCSCATKYNAPDSTKVVETTSKVKAGVKKAKENADVVAKAVKEAQETFDKIIVISTTIEGIVAEILKIAPEELKPPLLQLQTKTEELRAEESNFNSSLIFINQKQIEQQTTLVAVQAYEKDLDTHQQNYFDNAQKIADTATKLSAKVAWYQWHWWGSWIALGIGILLCLIFAGLKFSGKFFL